ncbi:MAG: hypothetical protein HY905_04035 [Deltaproteobacteria bacterium]|nr:hypothetical protein [Deltaproteobacteria bacterium]
MSKDQVKVVVELTERQRRHLLDGLRLLLMLVERYPRGKGTSAGVKRPVTIDEITVLDALINAAPRGTAQKLLPKEVAERLHRWGDRDDLYGAFEDAFANAYDQDEFEFGERDFYDPETGKSYRTQLALDIDESEPPDEDTCPECGGELADATDIPDDAICDACGWSRSGVRRCIRCGGHDGLVSGNAVCATCWAPGPPHDPKKGGRR